MSEIDFINQNKKNAKQKEEPEESADIEYSKPNDEEIDLTGGTPRKKSFFDFFGLFGSSNIAAKEKLHRPSFNGDRANKELWKKVIDKKSEKPAVYEKQPLARPVSPVPPKHAASPAKSEGIFSFLNNFGSSQAARSRAEGGSDREQSREVEEILLSKGLPNAEKSESAKTTRETAPAPRATRQKESDELDILQTNLIKDTSLGFIDWHKNLYTIIFSVISSILIITLAYGGIAYWGIKNIEKTKINTGELLNMEKNIDLGMARVQNDQILVSEKKFPAVKYLIENHIYWTKLFKFLEDNTLAKVYYNGFSGDTSGSYTLVARAENIKAAAEQIKAFGSNEWVLQSTTYGMSIGSSGATEGSNLLTDKEVNFSATLNLKPNIFRDYISASH